jgi:hypothetical protein
MGMIFNAIGAILIGFAAVVAAQNYWVASIMGQVPSQVASGATGLPQGSFKPAFPTVDPMKLRQVINGPMSTLSPADLKRFEALGIESAQRRIDMQIRNAQSHVPVPQRFGALPR